MRKLTVEVPVIVKGQSVGVRKGGKLQQSLHKVTIKCLPQHLVDALEVDVTNLDLGKSLHIRDLSLEGIEFVVPGDTIIVVCKVPRGVQIGAKQMHNQNFFDKKRLEHQSRRFFIFPRQNLFHRLIQLCYRQYRH